MDRVSISINGVTYDAVEYVGGKNCFLCDLHELCESLTHYDTHASEWYAPFAYICTELTGKCVFQKRD